MVFFQNLGVLIVLISLVLQVNVQKFGTIIQLIREKTVNTFACYHGL